MVYKVIASIQRALKEYYVPGVGVFLKRETPTPTPHPCVWSVYTYSLDRPTAPTRANRQYLDVIVLADV